jgi:hypothetical protein
VTLDTRELPATVDARSSLKSVLFAAAVAIVLCGGNHLLFGDLYLNLRDEGYLWYGVTAVGAGDVPLLDFQAYDPGRYYWCAFLGPLLGDGLLGIRGAVAAFQAIGITLGLLAFRRVVARDVWMIPMGLVLVLWSFPRFKLFESALTLVAVWAVTRLIERATPKRHLVLGFVVGVAAFFGRNHGLYLGVVSALLFALVHLRHAPERRIACLAHWAAGVVIGYSPLLLMLAFTPDFAAAFWEAVVSVLDRGANIPLAFPWAWGPAFEEYGFAGGLSKQLAFYLPVVLLPLGAVVALRTRAAVIQERAILIACVLVGGVYVHHYSLRSELPHLAQGALPVLLLATALVGAWRPRWVPVAVLALLAHASVLAVKHHPVLRHFDPAVETPELAPLELAGDDGTSYELRLKFGLARHLRRVRSMVTDVVPADEPMFIAPTRPTFYPLFDKLSPTWWIYFLWPATDEEQHETIERLRAEGVNWALVVEKSFTDDASFDFRSTNPLVWEHFATEWDVLDAGVVPEDYYVFRRRIE